MKPRFPAKLDSISPELITSILSERHPGVAVSAIEVLQHAHCGDGIASTADRVKLKLSFAQGKSAGVPETIVLKTILLHRYLRFGLPMILGLSKGLNAIDTVPLLGGLTRPMIFTLVNTYQRFFPHAPEAMYANEVRFYARIRPELVDSGFEAPMVYASVFDEGTGQFGVVMEDLGLKKAAFPNATMNLPVEQVANLIKELAKLHAKFWQSPRLESDLRWLPTTSQGGMFPVFDAIGLDLIRDQVAKNPFKQRLIAPLGKTLDELWALLWKSQAIIYKQPLTLLHGDTHVGNTYLLPENKGGWLDFQLMVKGPWCHDLNYVIATALSVDGRRTHEDRLLEVYFGELEALGVAHVPRFEDAIIAYRQTTLWGLIIGWLITPPQNYGEAITHANIEKMVRAVVDHGTVDLVQQS